MGHLRELITGDCTVAWIRTNWTLH